MKSTPKPERNPAQTQFVLVVDGPERPEPSWHIDDETREIGRKGLEQARAVLRSTRPRFLDHAA